MCVCLRFYHMTLSVACANLCQYHALHGLSLCEYMCVYLCLCDYVCVCVCLAQGHGTNLMIQFLPTMLIDVD